MDSIDLRSDTVTWPTEKMRAAMAAAELGDDVYGEDPTINRLQEEAAALLGKEAGLFVTSGTQGNLVALLTHCARGGEIIVGDKAHTFVYEAGGMSALGGIMPHIVPVQEDGTLRPEDIRRAIRGDNEHFPRTRLVTIENTQGTVGGVPLGLEYTAEVAEIARVHGLRFHIDGARIFNAAAACGLSVRELVAPADSITFCLSKGLCAPAGSILVGPRDFIAEARRVRKVLGGGMRQAGVLAAAGRIALQEMAPRIHEDHETAALLAEGLQDVPGVRIVSQHTNFVFFWLEETAPLSPAELTQKLQRDHNILMRPYPGFERKFRCVTHYWITPERVQQVIRAMQAVLS